MLHDTCDGTLLLGNCLMLVGGVVKRRILTRGLVVGCVVVERRGELEN